MVGEWLGPAIAAGSGALAAAVATDAWQSVRAGVVNLFGRAGTRREQLAAEWADATAAAITEAPEPQRQAVSAAQATAWRQRLADLVDEFPELGKELRAWAAEVGYPPSTTPHVFISRDNSVQYNAPSGQLTINHHNGTRPAS